MILTTNRVKDIDNAIQTRISVAMGKLLEEGSDSQGRAKYPPVDLD
jgi:hypothetical protein